MESGKKQERKGGIVVVEDEPVLLELVKDALEEQGYRVLTALSPADVEHVCKDTDPDLVLLDMMLPGESGMHVAQRFRETLFPHAPMIAMSADRLTLLFAQRSGLFQGTLSKPFEITQLLEVVRTYVGRYVTA